MNDLENRFTYHASKSDDVQKYTEIRKFAKQFAVLVDFACLEGREKDLAITKIEEAVMWANASISRR